MSDLVTTPDGDFPDDVGVLAGEYVLGVLQPSAMREVARRAAREPVLGDAIAWWEDRLHPLAAVVAPAAPPADLWSRIAASTGAAAPARPRLVWSNPRFWQATTAAAMALAAAVTGFAVLHAPPTAAPAHRYVAALSPLGAPGASFVAETTPGGSIFVRAVASVPVDTGKDLQLWALPGGAKAPVSLGLLPSPGRVVPPIDVPPAGTQLLISLEPAGGSPTGLPTGLVLFGGTLTQLD